MILLPIHRVKNISRMNYIYNDTQRDRHTQKMKESERREREFVMQENESARFFV